jgi:translocation and assembly module TamB
VKKRQVALAFVAFLLAVVAGSAALLRTRWAGDRICAIAADKLRDASRLEVELASCRIDPLRLEVRAEGVRIGPASAPVFAADAVAARLAPVQALGGRVQLRRVELVRPRVVARVAGGAGGGTCPPPFLDAFEIRRLDVQEGALELALPHGVTISAPRVDVRSDPGGLGAGLVRALGRAPRVARLEVDAAPVRVAAGARSWTVGTVHAAGEIALDLSAAEIEAIDAEVTSDAGGVRLGLRGVVKDLCAPRLDLTGTVQGPAAAIAAVAGRPDPRWAGDVAVEVRATGSPRSPALSATARFEGVRFGGFVPGDGSADVALEGDRLLVRRLEVAFEGGTVEARGAVKLARGAPVDLEVELKNPDLAEILGRVHVPGAWIGLRFEGRARLAGTLAPVRLEGALASDLRDLRVLNQSYETFPADGLPILEFERGRIDAGVRVDAERLSFDAARIAVGGGTVVADAQIGFKKDLGFRVHAAGTADLDALGHVAGLPLGGLATVDATIGAAPYGNPHVTGRARVERLRFLRVDLGTAAADVAYDPSFVLRFTGVEGVRNVSRYRGEVAVDLHRRPVWVDSARFEAKGRLRDLFEAVMDWLPRTRYLRDAMDGDVEVSGTASGRAAALDAEFDARLGAGALLGRPYDSGRAAGRIAGGAEAFFDRAEVRRGPGAVRARGRWGFLLPFPWDLDVEWSGLSLAGLDLPGGPWGGSASGTAKLAGSTERPEVKIAANGDAVSLRGVSLGSLQAGAKLAEGRLFVTGTADVLRFSAEARTTGRMPYRARAELALEDVARLLPGGAAAGLRAHAEGVAEAEGELADLGASRGTARLDRLTVGYADFKVESAAAVAVAFDHGRVEVQPFTLRGANTELALGGSRDASGRIDLTASGIADLRLLGGLVPALRKPHGQLAVEAHVGGTASAPVLVGAGQLDDAGFGLRDASLAVTGLRGDLAFSQNRVIFDELIGALNGGKVALRGEVELASFAPSRLRIEALLDDVPLAVPAALPATLTGRIAAEGTPDATTVSGLLHVIRARYTKDVEIERSLFELKKKAAPPKPYDPSAEWLRLDVRIAVDGDARIDNDLVRGGVRGDLTVTGTLASPGLVGTLSMTDGSRAWFRGNEFVLSRAVVTFADRHGLDGQLEVNGDAQVRDYVVHIHLFGSIAAPELNLTSDPALTKPDIITLLSLGFTGREMANGSGVGGAATAAAAQALFSASGLDEQVRRFLPRDGPVSDLALRITSGWSEATSQIEPRAEVESWLLRDRLRLRIQSPLSGTRGQKIQAEMRLGGNAALQYQWDNENPDAPAGGDHGLDLKLRWEWND